MFQHILIPLDGSSLAEQVLPLTRIIAVRFQSEVVLFQAVDPVYKNLEIAGEEISAMDLMERERQSAHKYLETISPKFASGIAVTREVRVGPPAHTLLDFADSAPCDLIAMATHGRTGLDRWVYGSVADKVLSGARLPILLVRPNRERHAFVQIKRILVPLDGSVLAEQALAPALQLAQTFNAELILFRVMESLASMYGDFGGGAGLASIDEKEYLVAQNYLNAKVAEIHGQRIRVLAGSEYGIVVERILESAQKYGVDLIVMSTHGHSGLGRWVMGSVADRVLRASPTPVLLIRASTKME